MLAIWCRHYVKRQAVPQPAKLVTVAGLGLWSVSGPRLPAERPHPPTNRPSFYTGPLGP